MKRSAMRDQAHIRHGRSRILLRFIRATALRRLALNCPVMPGLVPGIHVFRLALSKKSWMAGQ
jgi:hypothetical protein